ncbi:MAG: hypothetical protein ACKV2T_06635 [Kofleriaceae bacterium]
MVRSIPARCSRRIAPGGYDIYEAIWNGYQIAGPPVIVKRVDALSSTEDDNAPFVAEHSADMVFASKRDGGLGGWDLYCARWDEATGWTAPVALSEANSPSDEFRPSIADDRRFLIFSSKRPGGAGGFDLYTVKFEGCTAS